MPIPSSFHRTIELSSAIVPTPLVATPDMSVAEAIARMGAMRACCPLSTTENSQVENLYAEARASCVLVVDHNQLIGILTERDVVRLSAQQICLDTLVIRDRMTSPVITLRRSELTNPFQVIDLMREYHVRHLPILDEQDRLVGLITYDSLHYVCHPLTLLQLRPASDGITTQVICRPPHVSMLDIARLIAEQDCCGAVVIVQPAQETEQTHGSTPIGIVTERDLVQFNALQLDLEAYPAEAVMSAPVFSVRPNDSLWDVQQIMERHWIRHVVVTDPHGELLGLITPNTLLQMLSPVELQQLAEVMHERQVVEALQVNQHLLTQQQQFLETVINSSPNLIFVKDQDGRYLLANQAMAELYDTTVDALIGKRDADFQVNSHDIERFNQENRWFLETQRDILLQEEQMRMPGAADCWLQWYKRPIQIPKAQTLGILGVGVDITAHKQVQLSLEDSEQRLVSLAAAAPVGIFRTDKLGNCIYVNDRWCELLGMRADTALGHGWLHMVHPDDQEQVAIAWNQLLQENCPFQLEYRFQRPDSEIVWVYGQAVAEWDSNGQVIGYVGTITDISDRQKAVVALSQTKEMYANILASISDAVLITDDAGRLTYLSPNTKEIFDLSETELQTLETIQQLFGRDLVDVEELRQRGEIPNLEQRIYDKKGHAYDLLITVKQVHVGEGTILYVCRDITSRKQAERELECLNAELEQRVQERTAQLQVQEANLQDFFDNANDLIQSVCISNGRFEYVNRAWRQTLGYSETEVEHLTIFDVLHPDHHSHCQHLIAQMRDGMICDIERIELVFLTKYKTEILVEGSLNFRLDGDRPVAARAILRDITERRAAEQALQEREAYYRALMDGASDAILLADSDGNLVDGNRKAEELLGYSREELTHLKLQKIHPPDALDAVQAHFSDILLDNSNVPLETVLLQKDGNLIPVDINGSRIDLNGKTVAQGIFRDIRDRKASELAFQHENNFRRQILDNLTDGLYVCYEVPDYPFVQFSVWNPQMEVITGYTQDEINQLGWYQTLYSDPDQQQQAIARMAGMRQGRRLVAEEWEIQHRDGSKRIISVNTVLLHNSQDQLNVLGVIQDITQRKRAELALQASEHRFRRVFESNMVGMIFTDFSGRISDANDRFLDMLGYSREDFNAGQVDWLTLTPEEYYQQDLDAMVHLRNHGSIDPLEKAYLHKNGHPVYVLVGVAMLSQETGTCVCAVVDISERKRVEDERRQSENALRESRQFLRTVLDTFPLSVFWKDTNSVYLGCNRNFLRDLGLASVDDLVGKTDYDFPWTHPYAEEFRADDQQVMESNTAKLGIIESIQQPEDRRLWIETNKLPLHNVRGEVIGVLGTYQNISDRKETDIALRESEEKFRQLAEVVDSVFWILHLNRTERVYVSPAYIRIWGRACEELYVTPDSWLDAIHPDDRDAVVAAIPKQLDGTYDEEYRIVRPDGTVRWIRDRAFPIKNEQGEIYRLAGIAEDITERRQAEKTIQYQAKREALLREITQRIRQSLDLQTIFETACQEIRRVLQADRVGIFKFDPQSGCSDGVFVAESVVNGFRSVTNQKVYDHCFGEIYAPLYEQGRYAAMEDIYQLDVCHTNILSQFQVRANLVMPLLCGDTLWGLLCIHQCGSVRHWQQSEIDLSQQFANQLAIAIQQATLYKQVQSELHVRQQAEAKIAQQLRHQQILGSILQQIRESLNINEILATVTQHVKDILQGDRVIVFRLFADGKSKIVEESVSSELVALKERHWPDEVWSQDILDYYWQGKPRIVPDVMNDTWTDCLVKYSVEGQIQSKIVAPILQDLQGPENHRWVAPSERIKLWGILVIHACHEKRIWQDSEAELLQQIANQLAIAIQQAYLFDQVQQELTERQQAQQQLTERNQQLAVSNQELARATRLKDEFLANMSHELRTPLNAILGMTEGLQEEVFGAVNAGQLKALHTVETSATHLLALINDILDVAKIESGQIELEPIVISPLPLCSSSLAFVKQQALKKSIHLETRFAHNLPDLLVDERRIRQVLINLLTNAVKFTPEGGRITLSVAPVLDTNDNPQKYLRIAVKDTGIGIAPDNIDKLFKPFVQIDSALNRQYAGTGLGLALVKQIVELHGGQVRLTSELGSGSCFTVELPCVRDAVFSTSTPEVTNQTTSPDNPSPSFGETVSPLVLLVEDNDANIATTTTYLQAKGYRILLAQNGQDAIAFAQKECPDLILMDIQMPGMDGIEAMQTIRRNPASAEIPIIALTALAMRGDRDRCLKAGATEYLAKPVKLRKLEMMIRSLLLSREVDDSSMPLDAE